MSRPGKQFVIRRHAFAAARKAVKEHGIGFATPKVEVILEEDDKGSTKGDKPSSDRDKIAAGAAASQVVNLPEGSIG